LQINKKEETPGKDEEKYWKEIFKMERYCSTGQIPQRAVASMEEEEDVSC
jgi:hypothetical protein